MFLFILESIGTPELILIAVIALIIFGPRKLPQLAKTVGKTMADFRGATNEFKSTWAKEAAFVEDEFSPQKINSLTDNPVLIENSIEKNISQTAPDNSPLAPQVKELNAADIAQAFPNGRFSAKTKSHEENETEKPAPSKRDWL